MKKNIQRILLGLCVCFLVSCNAGIISFGTSTVSIHVMPLLENTGRDALNTRAVLDISGQTIELSVTVKDSSSTHLLKLDSSGSYSTSIDVPTGVEARFVIEAKDASGKSYVKGSAKKVFTKPQENLAIKLAPTGGIPISSSNIPPESNLIGLTELNPNIGDVYTFKFLNDNPSPAAYTISASNTVFTVCDASGTTISSSTGRWKMSGNTEVYILFSVTDIEPSISITESEVVYGSIYYVGSNAEVNNTGLTESDPVTLSDAVTLLNSNYAVTDENPAKIVLTSDITINDADFYYIFKRSCLLTSLSEQTFAITLGINRTNFLKAGDNMNKAHLRLENIIIQGFADPEAAEKFTAQNALLEVVYGSVTLAQGSILKNNGYIDVNGTITALNGGAVLVDQTGSLVIDGGSISLCKAFLGGAIYCSGGSVSFVSGLIDDCSAVSGGAVYMQSGTVTITDGEINACKALPIIEFHGKGGAVYAESGTFVMNGGSITNCSTAENEAAEEGRSCGGAVYLAAGSKMNLTGAVLLTGNTSPNASNIFTENYSLNSILFDNTAADDYTIFKEKLLVYGITFEASGYNEYLLSGDGIDASNSYKVDSIEALNCIRYMPTDQKYFTQTEDLNFEEGIFEQIPYFEGFYDGNSKTIGSVIITDSLESREAGLFAYVYGGSISNISLVMATINVSSSNTLACGLLAGVLEDVTISQCLVNGSIIIEASEVYNVGGLAGYASGSSFLKCASNPVLNGSIVYAGGLAGEIEACVIENCLVEADSISATSSAGGLIGYVNGNQSEPSSISTSYCNVSSVSGDSVGFIGEVLLSDACTQTNTYSIGLTTEGGVPASGNLPWDEAIVYTSYPGFDFENIWVMQQDGPPILQWMPVIAPPSQI